MKTLILCVGLFVSTVLLFAQDVQDRVQALEVLPVQDNISMLAGAGANITVQVGRDGVLLVDSGTAAMTDRVVDAIRRLSPRQVTYIVNTSDRPDHTGGNGNFAKLGRPLAINRAAQANVFIVAFNTLLDRMSDPANKVAESNWPNDTYSQPLKNLSFNGEAIQIMHYAASTDGDSVVLFRRADVISAGDIYDPTQYPLIDAKNGGSLQGVQAALFSLKQLVIPADHVEGGTMIVPGHGRISDAADLSIYYQMVTIVRDRLEDMIKRGMTLEQVKAARPTRDYDPIYGHDTGAWTTTMFVEAAYKSLTGKPGASE